MSKKYKYLVFIGRFQPFHNGHAKVIKKALELAEHVIVLIGSSNAARSWRNPWTYGERKDFIWQWYMEQFTEATLSIEPIPDALYDSGHWLVTVQNTVFNVAKSRSHQPTKEKIGLIGHSKDHSSFYLNQFPQWDSENVPGYDDKRFLDATWIRNLYFDGNDQIIKDVLPAIVPENVTGFLTGFYDDPSFEWLVGEHEYYVNYRKPYANLPHGIIFNTTDAVVVQSGHILLIERKARPGKGLLAMPGGFLAQNETIYQGVIRELREETGLNVPENVLEGSLRHVRPFDDPNRSSRGRVVTHAHLFGLKPMPKLPKVKGGDDAKRAFWEPLANLVPTDFFEDHYHIINHMTRRL